MDLCCWKEQKAEMMRTKMIKSDWVSDCLCSKLAKVSSDVLCVFGREAQALSQLQRCESSRRKADFFIFFAAVPDSCCMCSV